MNNKATLLLISWYAADYAGNFIRSLTALADRYDGEVIFVLPVEAKEKKWVSLLSSWQVSYISFEEREFAKEIQRIKQGCGQSVVVHGHFLCDHHLRSLNRLFPRVIDHYHMTVPEAPNNPVKLIKYGLVRQISRLSRGEDELVGVSPQVASDLQRTYPRCKVYCIPNAVDFARFKKSRMRHFCADSIRLLIFGTHYERKGVDLALTACEELRGHGLNTELIIATHDKEHAAEKVFEQLNRLPDWVTIQDVTESVEETYQLIDIFLSPSRHEAFGYAVVESYYSGCEVVASDVPGQNSLKEIKGIEWCASDDAESLAKAVFAVIEKLRCRKVVSIEDRRRYLESNYSIDSWIDSVLALYKGEMEPLS